MNLLRLGQEFIEKQLARFQWRRLHNRALDSFSISAPAGLVLLDAKLRVVRANDAISKMVGTPAHEMVGRDPESLTPAIAPIVGPMLRHVSATGVPALNVPITGETPAQPGVMRSWVVSVFPVDKWDAPRGYLGAIVVEVTDQLHFQLLTEAERIANIGSWEWNLLTQEVVCSTNLLRMLQLDTKRLSFHTRELRDLIHPQDRPTVREIIKHGLRQRKEYAYQARFLLPDGKERIFFTRAMPVLTTYAHGTRRIGICQDITERVEASRKLSENEERYRDLVENSQDLICTHDLDGRVLWMNELPARILGYSSKELIGHRIPGMLAPDVRYQFQSYVETLKREGYATGIMKLKTRSGETRYWEYRNTLRTEGVPKPMVRGMAHDITDLKRAEDTRRRQETTLRGLFETAQRLTRTLDLQTILDLLNSQAMTLIGASGACAGLRKEAGFTCDSFFEGDVRRHVDFVWAPGEGIPGRVLQNKKTYVTNEAERDPLIPPEIRRMLSLQNILCVPVFDIPKHEVIAFFALHNKVGGFRESDVTMAEGISTIAAIAIRNSRTYATVCEKEEELHRLSGLLLASQDAERRRVAQALHEQFAQVLAGLSMELGKFKDANVKIAPKSVKALNSSLTTLLETSRELRELSSRLYPVNLDLLGVRGAIVEYARTFSQTNGIEVEVEIPDDLGRLKPEEETTVYRIVQEALMNVERHSGSRTARIRMARASNEITLEIEDSGTGSPKLPNEGVWGIGLAGMKERARQHGGSIEIDNKLGAGFKIQFRFSTRVRMTEHAGRG